MEQQLLLLYLRHHLLHPENEAISSSAEYMAQALLRLMTAWSQNNSQLFSVMPLSQISASGVPGIRGRQYHRREQGAGPAGDGARKADEAVTFTMPVTQTKLVVHIGGAPGL